MSLHVHPRRAFLKTTLTGSASLILAEMGFLGALPAVSAAEAKLDSARLRLDPETEPLVRMIEETSRQKLLEEVGSRIRAGLSYQRLVAALFLAGVRNIQPRPVGFKFHAVLVVHSAHLASLASTDRDRWLPVFWALDYFKDAQERNRREGNWNLGPVDESNVPAAPQAERRFVAAMDNWDVAGADGAVVGLARSATPRKVFELFCHYGMRDFREIGHKAIYVANSWRMLQTIGWHHSEPVLRSLAYALLDHEGENPAKRDAPPDRPFRENLQRAREIKEGWMTGSTRQEASIEMLRTLRDTSHGDACARGIDLLNSGVAPASLWHAIFQEAGELLMRSPGIGSLHAVTSANALHFAFQQTASDETRRLLLLQALAFMTLFRGAPRKGDAVRIDEFSPAEPADKADLDAVLLAISGNKLEAARKALAYLQQGGNAQAFANGARNLVFLKGRDAHDYKFSSAVLEDFYQLPPGLRERYLASSVFQLRGAKDEDNELVQRTRAALT